MLINGTPGQHALALEARCERAGGAPRGHAAPSCGGAVSWLAELVAVVAPPGCVACRCALGAAVERLCPECTRALPWLAAPCPRCGLPKHGRGGCPALYAAFPRAWAPVAYEGVARRLVGALKFHGALAAADLMAAHMAANLPGELREPAAVLVPVPALPVRRRARGFDPAGVLTRALAPR